MAPLRIALYQGPGGVPGNTGESLASLDSAARRAADAGARALLTSELFLTGYAVGDALPELAEAATGPASESVAKIAAEHGLAIGYGYPERDGDKIYNAVQLIGPDGSRLANYRKTHLFGEFENAWFTPGDDPVVQADLDGTRIGLLICYDVEFPENVRAHALAGTELLLVPTALMRPYEIVTQTILPARAWENQLHIAYANRCGPEGDLDFAGLSCLVAPDGTARARAGLAEDLIVADADPDLLRTARAENTYLGDRRPELYGRLTERTR